MRRSGCWTVLFAALLATCGAVYGVPVAEPSLITTSSTIAIQNLDQQIVQLGDQPGVEELLLV